VGAVGVALNVIISQRLMRGIGGVTFAFHVSLSGSAIILAVGLLTGGFAFPDTEAGWAALSALPIAATLGTATFYLAISLIGGVKTSTIMNAEPVLTVLGAILFLHERFAGLQIAGALLVGVAILLVNWPERAASRAPPVGRP